MPFIQLLTKYRAERKNCKFKNSDAFDSKVNALYYKSNHEDGDKTKQIYTM